MVYGFFELIHAAVRCLIGAPSCQDFLTLPRSTSSLTHYRVLLITLVVVGVPLAAAPLQPITLQLNWKHQFQFAGYYAAHRQGYYREAGLEVTIAEARPGLDPVTEVSEGRAQFGVGTSALVLSRQQGRPVVVVAVIFQHSPLILLARADAGITSIHDLVGKRVMLETHSDELLAYLRKEGVITQSLTLLPHSYEPEDLLRGHVDAASAYLTDEPYFLERASFGFLTFQPRTGGIDFYGDNLFTSQEELKRYPARVKAFREASLRGWKYAMNHPEEIVDYILAQYGQRHDREHLLYEARRMASLIQPNLVEMGYMYRGRWQHIADTYMELGQLPAGFSLEGFIYDPDAGDRKAQRRMYFISATALAVALLSSMLALVFLHLSRRLRRERMILQETTAELARSEQQFRFLAEHSADVIWTLDATTGQFTYVSPSVVRLRGYTPEEVMAQPMTEALSPESLVRVNEVLAASLAALKEGTLEASTRITEVDQPHRDGHYVPTEVVTTLNVDSEGRLISILGVSRDITERRRAEAALQEALQTLEQRATTDPLTGAWNRRRFEELAEQEMSRARRHGQALSLSLLDIDHFKQVNDTYGHPEGDRVLKTVAERVRQALRISDSLIRWGGEEFIVLMPNTPLVGAQLLAERIREGVAGSPVEGIGTITVSIGVAEFMQDASLAVWLERADRAMYRAKDGGRNRVEVGGLPQEPSLAKLVWDESCRSGIPVVDAEHEQLFRLANDLLDLPLEQGDEHAILVARIFSALVQHFQDEEALLENVGFPGVGEHAALHAELAANGLELARAFETGRLPLSSLFRYLAYEVVAEHMHKADRAYFEFLGTSGNCPNPTPNLGPGQDVPSSDGR